MSAADDLRESFLTEGMTEDQRAALLAASDEVPFDEGDVLFVEGEPATSLWILLEGAIELSRQSATETIVVATMTTPGQWAGGLAAWDVGDNVSGYRGTGRGASPGRALRVPSEALGRLVGEWFPFGKHMIVGIYQTVRGIEALARQRESLVALGTLAAGLAHEINNPAAASLRAVEALRATCDAMLSSLTDLAHRSIAAEQFVALDALRLEAARAEAVAGSALEAADREEAVGAWLADRGLDDAWTLAPVLAAAGVGREWCAHVEQTVGPDALGAAVRWTVSTLNASTLLDEVHDTTSRISTLVDAVKSYSQMDRASRQRVDLHDGIESTLVMLSHKLRDLEVERDLAPDLGTIEVYAGELNQVWTNLIDNAIDATADIEGPRRVRIATRRAGDDVVVEITDNGHGMPPEVLARAFEPFFTTKDVGRGTGLGLDISRRIVVERHGGEITFDSSPAGTTARVRLPLGGSRG